MQDKTRTKRLKEIERAVDRRDTSTIIELCRAFMADYPTWIVARIYCARALTDASQYKKAKALFDKAIRSLKKVSPENLDLAYSGLGKLYQRKGDYRKAVEWFGRAAVMKPDEAAYLIFQGVAVYRSGNVGAARSIFKKATTCSEGSIDEAYYNLGIVLASDQEYDEALRCFKKAVEIDPKYKLAKEAIKDIESVRGFRN